MSKQNSNREVKLQQLLLSVFCWNIGNPSVIRASQQAEWLRKRPEHILVLTETKRSEGCVFLEKYFQAYGFNVYFPKPEGKEYGAMVVSKLFLKPSELGNQMKYLKSRVASVKVSVANMEIEIIGVYVPSRDSSDEKISKKKLFLEDLGMILKSNSNSGLRIFCGDLNILEPNHIPRYSFFKDWEYKFYSDLNEYDLKDAFRIVNPEVKEYSWVGRTGDGYRYDHCFISPKLIPFLQESYYLHEPREIRLSDHSALISTIGKSKSGPSETKMS